MSDSFSAPDHTSVNPAEYKPGPNIIPFAPELIGFILSGRKVTTYRFGNKYDYLNIGDLVNIQNSETKEIVGKAKITNKNQTTFQEIPLNTGDHESYRDKEHQRQVLSGYYAYIGRPIADNDPFLVFEFELVMV